MAAANDAANKLDFWLKKMILRLSLDGAQQNKITVRHDDPPPGYEIRVTDWVDDNGDWVRVLHHKETGVNILFPPLTPVDTVIFQDDADQAIIYHYTDPERFPVICKSGQAKATLLAERMKIDPHDTCFGDGNYGTLKGPAEFGSKLAILINNYTNNADVVRLDEKGQEEKVKPHIRKADYCIPILVARNMVKLVTQEATEQMLYGAGYTREGKLIRQGRDVCVVVMKNADGRTIDVTNSATKRHQVDEARRKGDVSAIMSFLGDPDHGIRVVAVEAFAQVAPKGDIRAIELIGGLLEYDSGYIRAKAAEAIAKVAISGDTKAMDVLAIGVKDQHFRVRLASVRAFAVVAPKGDTRAIELISVLLEDDWPIVRAVAAEALRKVEEGR